MTVSSEVKRKDYAGNGSTTNFSTVFRFLENSDVKVILTVDATAAETVQALDTDYTLVGAGLDAGGTVTMIVAPPTGTTLTVKRDVPLTQGTDYIENDDFPAESHEDALDKLTMIAQQMQEELDRSLKLSEAQQSSGLTLPAPLEANILQWDANDNLQNINPVSLGIIDEDTVTREFLTVASMVADTGLKVGDKARTIGYLSSNDGGGNTYIIVAAATGTDDGGSFIDLTGITGQAKGLFPKGIVNARQFGVAGDGVTDDTTKIQAALTFAGINGALFIPNGTHFVSATLNAPIGCWVTGESLFGVVIKRTGDYGDTLVFGTNSPAVGAGGARVENIFFRHGTSYATGDSSLDFLATSGAHIRMYGAQGAVVTNCWLWRLPSQVVFEGGSVYEINNCSLLGIYDHANAALQEGMIQLSLKNNANFVPSAPVHVSVKGCEFNGANVNARDVTLTSSDGSVVRSMPELIGSQWAIAAEGGEDFTISDNYFGGMNQDCLLFMPVSGKSIIDLKISDNHFDGARFSQIHFNSFSAGAITLLATITGNIFNGELLSANHIKIENTSASESSLVNFSINGNTCLQSYATAFVILAANGGTISDNAIESWNTLDAASTDLQWVSGIFIDSALNKNTEISGNVYGGGGNNFDQNVGNTFTYQGVAISETCVNVSAHDNLSVGIRTGTNFRTGIANTPNQKLHTVEANYQIQANEDIYIRKFAATAASVAILPLYPVQGREVTVKDGQGDVATWILIVNTADSTTIDGAASINITTDFGFMRFRFNGTEWNRIG